MAKEEKPQTRINFRLLVFCAFGLIFGIFLYFRIRFGGISPSDFLFCLLLPVAIFPFSWKRTLALVGSVILFAGLGAGLGHLCALRYERGAKSGDYTVTGTVLSFTVKTGRTDVVLEDLAFDGVRMGGKLTATLLSEEVRAGDIVVFSTHVRKIGLDEGELALTYDLPNDIRYEAAEASAEKVARSSNLLLRLNSALYDRLERGLGGEQAQIAYALLTGNSRGMDRGLISEVRRGGIAHIFAVSGLHIGILFGAVCLIFKKPCKKYAFLPALGVAILYAAFCNFTVSSLRAVIMCGVVGAYRAFGRKYDFLQAAALAALIVLILSPAQWFTSGFRLSFGACFGLALFSGTLTRLCKKLHIPAFLANYLSANLSVQIFTFPILLDCFGYVSLWGTLLNLFLVPVLPVFFLTVLLGAILALILPFASVVVLAIPKGMLSLFLIVFSAGSFDFALTGFALGAGAALIEAGLIVLSERVRMRALGRGILAGALAVLLTAVLLFQNLVFTGGRVDVRAEAGNAALVRTPHTAVLVIDDTISLADCKDFLARTYGGKLDGVFVLADNEVRGLNAAAFLGADAVYLRDEVATGLRETNVVFGSTAQIGPLSFRFETRSTLVVTGYGAVVAFDFAKTFAPPADLFVDSASAGLIFFFKDGIIKAL